MSYESTRKRPATGEMRTRQPKSTLIVAIALAFSPKYRKQGIKTMNNHLQTKPFIVVILFAAFQILAIPSVWAAATKHMISTPSRHGHGAPLNHKALEAAKPAPHVAQDIYNELLAFDKVVRHLPEDTEVGIDSGNFSATQIRWLQKLSVVTIKRSGHAIQLKRSTSSSYMLTCEGKGLFLWQDQFSGDLTAEEDPTCLSITGLGTDQVVPYDRDHIYYNVSQIYVQQQSNGYLRFHLVVDEGHWDSHLYYIIHPDGSLDWANIVQPSNP